MNGKPYTQQEIDFILKHRDKLSNYELSKKLGTRTEAGVQSWLMRNGIEKLRVKKKSKMPEEKQNAIMRIFIEEPDIRLHQAAAKFGISESYAWKFKQMAYRSAA